jgi:hypothetical protein
MPTRLQHAIETYLHAKDFNRPHRMTDAFIADAELAMTVHTGEIAFPPAVRGVHAIAATLSSGFAQRYENVYTYCIGAPPERDDRFMCDWLVCMTEKASGAARIGFGRYDWQADAATGKVARLHITIERMATLPADVNPALLDWARCLPYPWCPRDRLASAVRDARDRYRDAPLHDALRQLDAFAATQGR